MDKNVVCGSKSRKTLGGFRSSLEVGASFTGSVAFIWLDFIELDYIYVTFEFVEKENPRLHLYSNKIKIKMAKKK